MVCFDSGSCTDFRHNSKIQSGIYVVQDSAGIATQVIVCLSCLSIATFTYVDRR